MWLLFVIHLQLSPAPARVVHAEMVQTFASEKKCGERIHEIFKQAKAQGKDVPVEINMGCVPLNGKVS
jgi:hypothetical protein